MQTVAILMTILIATLPLSRCGNEPLTLVRPGLPMVDSLLATYAAVREAAESSDVDRLLALMEPGDADMLRSQAPKHGYNSLRSYLSYQMSGWPDPDTLSIIGVKRYGRFARLTFAGQAVPATWKSSAIRYTMILFKEHNGQWRFSAITNVEKDRYDHYGQEITFQDTDYPPKFRFPRLF